MYLSANRFPTTLENGIRFPFTHGIRKRSSRFRFRFPFSYYIENGIRASVFVFGFPTTLDNKILIVISVFRLSLG